MPDTIGTGLLVNRERLPFRLDDGIARKAAIGLVVLATDHTIEHEWRQMLRVDGVAFYESRIFNAASITPETLRDMEGDIARTAALIRPGERLDVLAFGCTSGTIAIGEDRVFSRLRESRPGLPCTTPITAALAACTALGARRVALLTPYVERINRMMRDWLEARGLAVPVMGSYNHENDNEVARIDAASVVAAVLELGRHEAVDAVFVSCTSLRVAALVERLEARLGKPVTSSNHAMAWHALRLAGCSEKVPGFGRLFLS
jgi:maleate isomerase